MPTSTLRSCGRTASGQRSRVLRTGDFIDTVNTAGEEIYARQEAVNMNRAIKIHTQSNPLPLTKRPGLVVKLTSSN